MRISENNNKKTSDYTLINVSVLLTSGLCTVLLVGWVLWSVQYGIDFADESFYLVWLKDPFKYSASTTQFGYIYHPLYKVVHGDIVALRQANILITFFLGWMLTFTFISFHFGQQAISLVSQAIAAAGIATASLIFFRQWLPTPSYNSLTFQGLMVSAIGLMLSSRVLSRASLIGWLLLGLGSWLTFMAKPTAAAALAASSLLYLVISRKENFRGISISILFSIFLVLCSALVIDGSILLFSRRLLEGLELAKITSSSYGFGSVFRIDNFDFSFVELQILFLGSLGLFIYIVLANSTFGKTFVLWIASFFGSAIVFLFCILFLSSSILEPRLWTHLIVWMIPIGSLIFGMQSLGIQNFFFNRSSSNWSLFGLFIFFPYAFALGTGSNYWFYQGLATLFWVLAGLLFLRSENLQRLSFSLLSVGSAVQLLSALIILLAVQYPYYQPAPLRNANYQVDFGRSGSKLIVHESFGQYITDAVSQADQAGFVVGTPMIDLTGRSPGVLYALGAASTGSAWIYGNYINSRNSADTLAIKILASVKCEELSRAWLLVEPEGTVRISQEVLKVFGAELARDYQASGNFMTTPSIGGFPTVGNQILFKPIRSVIAAEAACEIAKELSVRS